MKNNLFKTLLIITLLYAHIACSQEVSKTGESKESGDKTAMLLGVYHFNNPGKDTYNKEIDDYFLAKRQEELEEVAEQLKEFKPTKIYVEFMPVLQPKIDSLYNLYLKDKITLNQIKGGTNEVYQIGFRLGKELNGIEILAIDHSGNWLGPYADFIADTLALDYYQNNNSKKELEIKEEQSMLLQNTVKENLVYTNNWEQIMKNHGYYNNVAIKVKDTAKIMFTYQEAEQEINGLPYQMRSFDFENIGVDLVAEWYKRNLFIYRNILENTNPNDRVLIIFGQSHIRYLHQLLSDNPEFNLISPNDYLIKE